MDIRIVGCIKGRERYIWIYEVDQTPALFRSFGRMANDEDLTFSWYDAARLSKRLAEESREIPPKDGLVKRVLRILFGSNNDGTDADEKNIG